MISYAQKEDLLHVNKEHVPIKMIKSKRGMSAWIWILIILIVLAVGIGAYFLLTGDSSLIATGGSSIPQPPALPTG